MARKRQKFFPFGCAPKPDGIVAVAAGEDLGIGAKGEHTNASLCLESMGFFARIEVPDRENPMGVPRGKTLAIGREGHRGHWVLAPRQPALLLARKRTDDPNVAFIIASRHDAAI